MLFVHRIVSFSLFICTLISPAPTARFRLAARFPIWYVTPIDSPCPADSNETLADSIRPLVIELPQPLVSSPGGVPTDFSLVTATGGPQPRALYHSIRLIHRILMRPLRNLVDA